MISDEITTPTEPRVSARTCDSAPCHTHERAGERRGERERETERERERQRERERERVRDSGG